LLQCKQKLEAVLAFLFAWVRVAEVDKKILPLLAIADCRMFAKSEKRLLPSLFGLTTLMVASYILLCNHNG
jgi:hypothetical protein